MNTYNTEIHRNLLLGALTLKKNVFTTLSEEFRENINPIKTVYTSNNLELIISAIELINCDYSNCLVPFPLATDPSHMEGLTLTGNDSSLILEVDIQEIMAEKIILMFHVKLCLLS